MAMGNILKEFWQEEEGMGTVEIVLIIAVLVSIAMMFRGQVIEFVGKNLKKIFEAANTDVTTETE